MANPTRSLMSLVLLAAVIAGVAAPSAATAGGSNALVRVEVIDHDAGTRVRSSTAVAWSQTATVSVELSGHAHTLAITPHAAAGGPTADFDHTRDGIVVADDLRLDGSGRRFVIDNASTTVVVTIVSVKTSVQSL